MTLPMIDVILVASYDDDPVIGELNKLLDGRFQKGIFKSTGEFSGGRRLTRDRVWQASFNCFSESFLIEKLRDCCWTVPEKLQVMIKGNNGKNYTERTKDLEPL